MVGRTAWYWLAAAAIFVVGLVLGGAASASPTGTSFFPVRSAGLTPVSATGLFVHNATVATLLCIGPFLVGLPTVALLGYNGFVVGSMTVGAVATRGPVEALALLVPHAVVELPAFWLAGAVGLRLSHAAWKTTTGKGSDVGGPSLVAEALVVYGVSIALLAVAAVVEAQVTPAVFHMLA